MIPRYSNKWLKVWKLMSGISIVGGLEDWPYVYNKNTVEILDMYKIYDSQAYWKAFPRSPLVMEMRFGNENYIIINNHFKCCGDGILDVNSSNDEENRRLTASNLLKQYIDNNLGK